MPRFTMGRDGPAIGFFLITLAMALFALPLSCEFLFSFLEAPRHELAKESKGPAKISGMRMSPRRGPIDHAGSIGRQSSSRVSFIGVASGCRGDDRFRFSRLLRSSATSPAKGGSSRNFGNGSVKGPRRTGRRQTNAACTGSFRARWLTTGDTRATARAILLGALMPLKSTPGPWLMVDEATDLSGRSLSPFISATSTYC